MRRGLKVYNGFLYTINSASYPSTQIYSTAIPDGTAASSTTACFIGFPLEMGIYPLSLDDNQLSIQWNIQTMPTAATYVKLTPFSFAAFKQTPSTPKLVPGLENATGNLMLGNFTFDSLDTANNCVSPYDYAIKRTAADVSLTLSSSTFLFGTHHLIPATDPYIGFYISHDGTNATGSHSIFASLRWT